MSLIFPKMLLLWLILSLWLKQQVPRLYSPPGPCYDGGWYYYWSQSFSYCNWNCLKVSPNLPLMLMSMVNLSRLFLPYCLYDWNQSTLPTVSHSQTHSNQRQTVQELILDSLDSLLSTGFNFDEIVRVGCSTRNNLYLPAIALDSLFYSWFLWILWYKEYFKQKKRSIGLDTSILSPTVHPLFCCQTPV